MVIDPEVQEVRCPSCRICQFDAVSGLYVLMSILHFLYALAGAPSTTCQTFQTLEAQLLSERPACGG